MTELPFTGYPGQVWGACWQAMDWLAGVLASGTAAPATAAQPASLVLQTLINGASAISAWQTSSALTLENANLTAIQALPLNLDPVTLSYTNNRISAVAAAASGINAILPPIKPLLAVSQLAANTPAIADPGFIPWCMGFDAETPPTNLGNASITTYAQAETQAWLTAANAISALQGGPVSTAYDAADRMYRCCNTVSTTLSQIGIAIFSDDTSLNPVTLVDGNGNPITDGYGNIIFLSAAYPTSLAWNSLAALPVILLDGATLSTAPSLLSAQQALAIRYALNYNAQQIAYFLYAIRPSAAQQPIVASLRNTDSLADLAARQTGGFDNWTDIASINSLLPPYPGPTNQTIAQSGQKLFMPGSNVAVGANSAPPDYDSLILGTDYDFGPINGSQPTWLGDIPLITGLQNFARAIGRRLQTPLGSLIYDPTYGSRIPGEVGAVQSTAEAARLASYGQSAIAADPRTGTIQSVIATVQPGFLATFSAVVQPIGPSLTPVQVSGVITPPGT